MIFGSLFTGIGGLDLGLERAGMRCAWQVESDADARRVLEDKWPTVRRFDDVRHIKGQALQPVDVIAGGFPCQDLSPAGRRIGIEGARSGLWREFARIVDEHRPRFVVVENTARNWRAWVPRVRGDLARTGYTSMPILLRAGDLGALHRRPRCFVVADAHCARKPEYQRVLEKVGQWAANGSRWPTEPRVARVVHGVRGRARVERLLGNAVCPPVAEAIGRIVAELGATHA